MKEKIILVDFAGTLIKTRILDEANKLRSSILKRNLPSSKEHAHPDKLYEVNRGFVEKLTGIKSNHEVQYRMNNLDSIVLKGDALQNQIATNLFQIGMYMAAKKYKSKIFQEGLITELKLLKKKGYKLAIVSGVREDIISGMLVISNSGLKFDYVLGQPPVLGVSNEANGKKLKSKGVTVYAIGDKMSDLKAGKQLGAKTIFVRWGHPSGGETEFADYSIKKPADLRKIIR
ncbi:MAG: HAD family hydrolase [Nanoarchaeota archaeon]|nr:HAD family hydrolase [Nanoarchaeota archaeon]